MTLASAFFVDTAIHFLDRGFRGLALEPCSTKAGVTGGQAHSGDS